MATLTDPEIDKEEDKAPQENLGGANLEFKIKENLPLKAELNREVNVEELTEIKAQIKGEFPYLPEDQQERMAKRRLAEKNKKKEQIPQKKANKLPKKAAPKPPRQPSQSQQQPSQPQSNQQEEPTRPPESEAAGEGRTPAQPQAQKTGGTSGGAPETPQAPQTPAPPAGGVAQQAGAQALKSGAKAATSSFIGAIASAIAAAAPFVAVIALGVFLVVVIMVALCKVPLLPRVLGLNDVCAYWNISEINPGQQSERSAGATVNAPLILSTSTAEIGNHEDPLGSNAGPQINKYFRSEATGQAWCSFFATWVLNSVVGFPAIGGVADLQSYFVSKEIFIPAAQVFSGSNLPQPGDVAFFQRMDNNGNIVGGHVGIVKQYEPATSQLQTIDGNVSDRVGPKTRNLQTLQENCDPSDQSDLNKICHFLGLGRLKY